ncbi:uncharacterized protein NPIL_547071 [Nephila pilipes]|uniref:Uncharacterized protein n=1 Tax=Nephila pilipes TaxID=299642 RepID=A0A8X6QFY4_NEPPI|nr:uncharacterized protein NPIL_547071 [Nephila pilipes]
MGEDNLKSNMMGKRKLRQNITAIDATETEKKSSLKDPENSPVSKRTRIKKIKNKNVKKENKIEDINFDSCNSLCDEKNEGNQDEVNIYPKKELDVIQEAEGNESEVVSKNNPLNSVASSNGYACTEMNSNFKITSEVNLLLLEMINHVCENDGEIKIWTATVFQLDTDLRKGRNILVNNNKQPNTEGIVTNIPHLAYTKINGPSKDINASENSNFNNPGFKRIQDLKIFENNPDNSANKITAIEKDMSLRNSGETEITQKKVENEENRNISDFQEENVSKFNDQKKTNEFKRRKEYKMSEANETDLNGIKQKKQKMNCETFSEILESDLSNELKNSENLHLNRNDSKNSLKDYSGNMVHTPSRSKKIISHKDTFTMKDNLHNGSNEKLRISNQFENIAISRYKLTDNLESQNFQTDFSKIPESYNKRKSLKKTLSIPYMSALDYDKEFKLMNIEPQSKKSQVEAVPLTSNQNDISEFNCQNFNLCSFSKKRSIDENLSTINNSEEKILSDFNSSNEDSLKITNKANSKLLSSEMEVLCCKRTKYDNKSDTISQEEFGTGETDNNLDKMEHQINSLSSSETMNIISDITHIKKQNIENVLSKIFTDDNFIPETITFREKGENDDTDVIPTGIFKHLNEIYEYNTETTSIHVKCASGNLTIHDVNNFQDGELIKSEEIKNKNSSESPIEKLKMGESIFLISGKDCITSANKTDITSQQENRHSEKNFDVENENPDAERDIKKIYDSLNVLSKSKGILNSKTDDYQHNSVEKNKKDILEIIGGRDYDTDITVENMNETKENKYLEKTCIEHDKTSEEKYFTGNNFQHYKIRNRFANHCLVY